MKTYACIGGPLDGLMVPGNLAREKGYGEFNRAGSSDGPTCLFVWPELYSFSLKKKKRKVPICPPSCKIGSPTSPSCNSPS